METRTESGKISILFTSSLRGRKQSQQAYREFPGRWKGYSLECTLLSRLKINESLEIPVVQARCRLLGRWFHFISESNSRSETVHYDWMSFWKIQALYILQYSCLENPMDRGAWQAEVQGITKSRTGLSHFTSTFHFHALEKEMATHSSVLAWRIPGTEEPGGLPSMGSHRVGHGWSDAAAAAAAAYIQFMDKWGTNSRYLGAMSLLLVEKFKVAICDFMEKRVNHIVPVISSQAFGSKFTLQCLL